MKTTKVAVDDKDQNIIKFELRINNENILYFKEL